MTALTIIGFIALVLLALTVTAAAIACLAAELGFSGELSPFSIVYGAVSIALWMTCWYLSPFTIVIEGVK